MAKGRKNDGVEAETNGSVVAAQEFTVEDAEAVANDPNDPRMTIKQAAEYLGLNPQTFRNTIKTRPEFTASGVVIHETIEGTNYTLVKISKSALDAYDVNRKSGDPVRMRDGTRKFIIKLTAEQLDAFKSGQLDTTAIDINPASQRAVKAETANGADEEANEAPEAQGDNDLSGASADTDDRDGSIFQVGIDTSTHDEYENSQVDGQRW